MNNFFGNQRHASMQDKLASVFKFKDVSPKTQEHLKKVYGNLAICTGICATAMYLNAYTIFSGFIMSMISIVGMSYMIC